MSGIFGVVHVDGTAIDRYALERMEQRLTYRGPDAQAVFITQDGNVALGNTLYKLAPESAGERQPLTMANVTITADARLDDRPELIRLLKASGGIAGEGLDDLHTIPDSELVLRAYLAWGDACVEHLFGDFAFAIWDAPRNRLFAACDHFGVCTLYYTYIDHPHFGRTLVFANELTLLRLYPTVSSQLNEQAIGDFLLFGNLLWLERSQTIFENTSLLLPAHTLVVENGNLSVSPYWTLPSDEPMIRYRTEQDYIEQYRHLLKQAVKDRLQTDSAVISMSGGVDSTTLAAIGCELVAEGAVNTKISAVVAVYDRIFPDTEAYYAGLVSRKFDLPTYYVPLDEFTIKQPFLITAQPAQSYLSDPDNTLLRLSGRLGKLLLTGDGSDEALRETPIWDTLRAMPFSQAMETYQWLWRFLKHRPPLIGLLPYLQQRLDPRVQRQMREANGRARYNYPAWLNPEFEARLGLKERWDQFWNWEAEGSAVFQPQAHKAMIGNMWGTSPEQMDAFDFTPPRMIMPFIDLRLVRFVLALPPQPFNRNKYILRQAMHDTLPSEVLKRPKTPLGALIQAMLQLPDARWVDEWEPISEVKPYIRREAVPKVTGGAVTPGMANANLRPLALNYWLQQFYHRERMQSSDQFVAPAIP
jgi:asparagine synthase (glutamine-hydrolysing)